MTTDTRQPSAVELATELAERFLHSYNEHDLEAVAECMDEEVSLHSPDTPEPIQGRAAVLDRLRATFATFPDFHVDEPDRWIAPDGDTVATRVILTGTFSGGRLEPPGFEPTGERLEFSGMDRIEIRNGRIVRWDLFFDMLAIGQKIGAAPPPGSFGERLGVAMQRRSARRRRRKAKAH